MTKNKNQSGKPATKPVVKAPAKAKGKVRGYKVVNPKQPERIYNQRIIAKLEDGSSFPFVFFGNDEQGEPRGCIIPIEQQAYVDYFKKKGFTAEEIRR